MSLIRSATCGMLAGAAGTLTMDLLWYVRYKRGGGDSDFLTWDFFSAPSEWNNASAPARVGKLVYETVTRRELPPSRIGLTTNVMHWGYGKQWGLVAAIALGSGRGVKPWQAPLLGLLVWLSSYVSLPIAGFYKPIWSYDLKTLGDDLSAHLVYGTGTILAFWATCRF